MHVVLKFVVVGAHRGAHIYMVGATTKCEIITQHHGYEWPPATILRHGSTFTVYTRLHTPKAGTTCLIFLLALDIFKLNKL